MKHIKKSVLTVFLVLFALHAGNTMADTKAEEPGAERPVIRAAYCENMAPFQFTDPEGHADGMHIDLVNEMADRQGMTVQYLPCRTRAECVAALDAGEADLVLGYPMGNYDSAKYQTTGELSKATLCILVRKGLSEGGEGALESFASSEAVFELGSVDYAYMRSMGMRKFMAVSSQKDVVRALLEKKTDIALGTSESLVYMLKEAGAQGQYRILHDQIASINYAILLGTDNQRLRTVLDTELAELRTGGRYEEIYKKWITSRDVESARKLLGKVLVCAAMLAGAAFLVIGIIVQLNRILRKKVAEKTGELYEANTLLEQQVELLQSERDLRGRIIEAAPTGILFLDRARLVTVMNPAAQRMCGVRQEEAAGRSAERLPLFGELIAALDREMGPGVRQKDQPVRHQELKPYLIELTQDEEMRKYRCWFHWLRDDSGGSLLMAEDVTREEAERKAAFEADKTQVLGRLVAGIAHELKNPLMNLKTAVSLILTQGDRPEVKEAFARFIPEEVERMNRLVEGLLNYSRPTREKAEIVNLPEIVNSCLYLTQITAKGIRIECSAEPDGESYICVQKDVLRQSLINILINSVWSVEKKRAQAQDAAEAAATAEATAASEAAAATEATAATETVSATAAPASPVRPPAPIQVRVYRDAGWVCLSVLDRGIGMDAEAQRRCTDPFYTTKKAGTGLGLALTKQFAEDNGGTLTVRSEAGVYTEILLKFRRCKGNQEVQRA